MPGPKNPGPALAPLIAEELRLLRGARTQQKAADLLGIARPNLARYEKGTHEPSLSTLVRNITLLGGDPAVVLTRVLERARSPHTARALLDQRGSGRTRDQGLTQEQTLEMLRRIPRHKPRGFALPDRSK